MDYLFLYGKTNKYARNRYGLNPYFNGLSILMLVEIGIPALKEIGLNPYFNGLSILICIILITPPKGVPKSQSLF